jgi:hypothetical protein
MKFLFHEAHTHIAIQISTFFAVLFETRGKLAQLSDFIMKALLRCCVKLSKLKQVMRLRGC